jgi:hypothetical protein
VCVNGGEVYLRAVDTFGYEVEVAQAGVNVFTIEEVKPYLRPMSSMTEEERDEFVKLHIDDRLEGKIELCDASCVDFYNSHHLDYRGLIEKGLALEAPEGMYNHYDEEFNDGWRNWSPRDLT